MHQKGNIFLGILIGLLIAGGLSGAYYLGTRNNKPQPQNPIVTSQTPKPSPAINPTGSLTEYSNSLYSFSYPNDWLLDSSNQNSTLISKEQSANVEGSIEKIKSQIIISSAPVSQNTTLDDWLKERYSRNDQNLFNLILQFSKKTTLAGSDAINVTVPGGAGFNDDGVITIYKGRSYNISLTGFELSDSQQTYQTILSTFKFTN